jgi:hypothetical protein
MKERDRLVKNENKQQQKAAKRLRDLNKDFLKTVRISQKRYEEMFVEKCRHVTVLYEMVLEELMHYHNSIMVEEMAEKERARRVSVMELVTSKEKVLKPFCHLFPCGLSRRMTSITPASHKQLLIAACIVNGELNFMNSFLQLIFNSQS